LKKICFLVQEYYPKDARVRKYVNLLLKEGYLVDVLSLKRKDLPRKEVQGNLTIYRTGLEKKRGGLFRYAFEYFYFFFCSFFRITILHARRKYEIIHVNNLPDFLVFSCLIPKLFGTRLILDMHEISPEFFQVKFAIPAKSGVLKLLKGIERVSLRFSDYVITVTEPIKDIFVSRSIDKKKIEVIMNVPEEAYVIKKNLESINLARSFNLVYHGTLTRLYSLDTIVRAIAITRDKIPQIKLNIYGEGPEEEQLKKMADNLGVADIISFQGNFSHENIQAELTRMDFGILPISKNIYSDLSFSNKLGEYVASGIPVIITDIVTVKHYFPEDCLFYFSGDHTCLASTLEEIYSTPREMIVRKIQNAEKIYSTISWDIMSVKYLNIIQQLIRS
jgi:glycosyltransferase involved in cell wall biosynthesis